MLELNCGSGLPQQINSNQAEAGAPKEFGLPRKLIFYCCFTLLVSIFTTVSCSQPYGAVRIFRDCTNRMKDISTAKWTVLSQKKVSKTQKRDSSFTMYQTNVHGEVETKCIAAEGDFRTEMYFVDKKAYVKEEEGWKVWKTPLADWPIGLGNLTDVLESMESADNPELRETREHYLIEFTEVTKSKYAALRGWIYHWSVKIDRGTKYVKEVIRRRTDRGNDQTDWIKLDWYDKPLTITLPKEAMNASPLFKKAD